LLFACRNWRCFEGGDNFLHRVLERVEAGSSDAAFCLAKHARQRYDPGNQLLCLYKWSPFWY